jgi:CRP-like cAMP-binding protein
MQSLFDYVSGIQELSPDSKEVLTEISETQEFKKGSTIQPIGHTCRTIYFVNRGALRVYYFKDAHEITESFEFENAFVARAESLFSGEPSRKAIEAIEDSEVVAINTVKLFDLYDQHRYIERLFRKLIEKAYIKTVNRIESLQFHTAAERYAQLLSEHPDVLLRVPLKMIASYLGITPESLSRIRASK